ncbi:hypothetical protein O6H91_07G083000 [Diphasiastrum complanatum]|nr:hypothetical protein O6H91_07G083000 [Diphasiastrum complanatum]
MRPFLGVCSFYLLFLHECSVMLPNSLFHLRIVHLCELLSVATLRLCSVLWDCLVAISSEYYQTAISPLIVSPKVVTAAAGS